MKREAFSLQHSDHDNDEGLIQKAKHFKKDINAPKNVHFSHIYGNIPGYYGCREATMASTQGENVQSAIDSRLQRISEFYAPQSIFTKKRIIDIGCNAGNISLQIAKYFEPNFVLGVDIDPSLVKKSRHHLQFQYSLVKPSMCNRLLPGMDNPISTAAIQEGLSYFPISMPIEYGYIPLVESQLSHTCQFPFNLHYKCQNWIESELLHPKTTAATSTMDADTKLLSSSSSSSSGLMDVVICFSLTKWIHLNWGDKGILALFNKICKELKEDGILLLEFQDFENYTNKSGKWAANIHRENYNQIKIMPNTFESILKDLGFTLIHMLEAPSGSSTAAFYRPIYIFQKDNPSPGRSSVVASREVDS